MKKIKLIFAQNYKTILLLNLINFILLLIIQNNLESIIYALDDAYIHLSLAKNFVEYGVWGLNKFYPAASSSSPLFSLILIITTYLFGSSEYLILIVNLVVFNLLIISIILISDNFKFSKYQKWLFIGLIYFITPVFANIINGMEHLLQILINLCYIYFFIKKKNVMMLVFAALSTSIRYEGLFLVLAVSIVLFFNKEYKLSIYNGLISIIPVVLFGLYFYSFSGSFLPNSVILKGAKVYEGSKIIFYLTNWIHTLIAKKQMIPVFFMAIFYLYITKIRKIANRTSLEKANLSFVFIIALVLHLNFAQIGWFFRYEAYLLAIMVFLFVYFLDDIRLIFKGKTKLILLTLLLINTPLIVRGGSSFYRSIKMPETIYNVHILQSQFIKDLPELKNQTILGADMGAISYFTDLKIIDLNGLGNNEVRDKYLNNEFNEDFVLSLIEKENIHYALVYKDWSKYLPEHTKFIKSWGYYNYSSNSYLEIVLYKF